MVGLEGLLPQFIMSFYRRAKPSIRISTAKQLMRLKQKSRERKVTKSMSDHAHYRVPKPLLQRSVTDKTSAAEKKEGSGALNLRTQAIQSNVVCDLERQSFMRWTVLKNSSGRFAAARLG
ncbi:hypothetical protein EVAR_29112_1 [Eumeta japonica]|uniref:Uncharacterized protein n=1 Tax=Eumeta variegata TaxID=151549 RepID=A0A4C1VNA5_EUMVA|nr:hypothetical protein EVAR_29112_1 [Eumeta japonica]